ncbi:MAG: hypothetical protein KatS3mg087_0447 [Patescibacteria group bacterium]|nr:MAG: hypothetical protein KatS3mg087_0447 [Patescibacteria group bacterium]
MCWWVCGPVAQWQSGRLITAWSQVRILPGPPRFGYVGISCGMRQVHYFVPKTEPPYYDESVVVIKDYAGDSLNALKTNLESVIKSVRSQLGDRAVRVNVVRDAMAPEHYSERHVFKFLSYNIPIVVYRSGGQERKLPLEYAFQKTIVFDESKPVDDLVAVPPATRLDAFRGLIDVIKNSKVKPSLYGYSLKVGDQKLSFDRPTVDVASLYFQWFYLIGLSQNGLFDEIQATFKPGADVFVDYSHGIYRGTSLPRGSSARVLAIATGALNSNKSYLFRRLFNPEYDLYSFIKTNSFSNYKNFLTGDEVVLPGASQSGQLELF